MRMAALLGTLMALSGSGTARGEDRKLQIEAEVFHPPGKSLGKVHVVVPARGDGGGAGPSAGWLVGKMGGFSAPLALCGRAGCALSASARLPPGVASHTPATPTRPPPCAAATPIAALSGKEPTMTKEDDSPCT